MPWLWDRAAIRGQSPAKILEILDLALDRLGRALTIPEQVVTIPSVADVYTPDMGRAVVRTFQINRTTGAAFTIAKPIGFQSGAILTIDLINTSGGALGAITWAAEYLLLTTFVPPGNGGRATVTFYCASSALVEIASQPDQTAAGGAGEANTGSNQNTGGGVGVFSGKVGIDLQFRGIKSTSSAIAVALNAGTKEIELTGSAGGVAASGIDTIDFGAFPGTDIAVTAIADAGIVAGSIIQAWLRPLATADHSGDDHLLEQLDVFAHSIVAGVGFSIRGISKANHRLWGVWNVSWVRF